MSASGNHAGGTVWFPRKRRIRRARMTVRLGTFLRFGNYHVNDQPHVYGLVNVPELLYAAGLAIGRVSGRSKGVGVISDGDTVGAVVFIAASQFRRVRSGHCLGLAYYPNSPT